MKSTRLFLFLVILLSVTALACRLVTGAESPAPQQASSSDLTVLFKDDFSNSSSGWDDYEDEEGITGYRDGGYRILINKPNWYFWATPGKNFSDVIIDVDATKIGGPDNNEFGVICRYQDENNFYIISISSDGYYGISKFTSGELYPVGMDQMLFNDKVIKLGASTNHIRASCIGENLTLEVNGEVLADVQDSDHKSGDVGLIASTFDETGTDILFDNFVVSRP